MKQLKFMLAAATAVGIAAVAQADIVNQPVASENFESYTTETPFANLTGFSYTGATATDNESAIIEGGATTESSFALQVNTGTDPILRKLDTDNDLAVNLVADKFKKLYINTMVQFTVTPEGDDVEAKADDKLMIYLKEVPEVKNEEGEVTAAATTKLMVKAAKHSQVQEGRETKDNFIPYDVAVSVEGVTVSAGNWYQLEVSSYVENSITLFTITLNGIPLVADEKMYLSDNARVVFPSLLGKTSQTLDYVGFAGEGKVDDIVITKDVEGVSSVDFTFTLAWDAAGFSSVTYTIDGGEAVTPVNGASFTVPDGKQLVIDYTLNDWYKISGTPVLEYTAAVNGTGLLTLEAVPTANVDSEGNVEVTTGTQPTDVYVSGGSFASTATEEAVAELNKALTWAKKVAGKTTASAAGELVSDLNFADETETPAEQAYLLNCDPNDAEELKAAKDNFKFEASDLTKLFDVDNTDALSFDSKNYNGTVILEGKGELSGEWKVKAVGHKFFRARLVK